jgi:hypothetical protein
MFEDKQRLRFGLVSGLDRLSDRSGSRIPPLILANECKYAFDLDHNGVDFVFDRPEACCACRSSGRARF